MQPSKPLNQPDKEGYYLAASIGDIGQDKLYPVEIDGNAIVITKHREMIIAFNASCPHASGNLGDGQLYNGRIDCPVHAYRFDIATGIALWPPDEPVRLKQYQTKIIDDQVLVKL